MPSLLIVHHRVADFDAWKAVYDSVGGIQARGGVLDHAVLRDPDDPGMVVVLHSFATREQAAAFLGDEDLKQAMGRGGVDPSTFRAEILDEVATGSHRGS